MKRTIALMMVLLLAVCGAAMANEWIANVTLQGDGWSTVAGAGYNGSDAYSANTMNGVRRANWTFDFADMSTTAFLAEIWVYVPTAGPHGWQPVEVTFNGSASDAWPIEPNIPWYGQYGTNHQYLGNDWNKTGQWVKCGMGPQGPTDSDYYASGNGDKVWVKKGSTLYTKWDFGWAIGNTVSAVKLVTVPEPSSLIALLAGVPALLMFRRKR